MSEDEYPAPTSRPKLNISFDDGDAPAPPAPAAHPVPYAYEPPPPVAYPKATQPPPPAGPPAPNHAMAVAAMSMNRKSPGVAVLLSLLFTGAGQIYCGRAGRGIAFFAAAFFSALMIFFIIGIFMLLAVWIWAAIDAANLASKQNATLLAAMSGGGWPQA